MSATLRVRLLRNTAQRETLALPTPEAVMRRHFLSLLALALAALASPTFGQDAPALPGQSAQVLVAACKAQGRHLRYAVERQWDIELFGQIDYVECTAYLAGIADMNAVAKRIFGRGVFCFPRGGVSAEQQVAAVLRWSSPGRAG